MKPPLNYCCIFKINIGVYFICKNIPGSIKCPFCSCHYFAPLKTENDSKNFVPTSPMIMSLKVLKYFSCRKVNFFCLLACGKEISNWKNRFFFGNLDLYNIRLDRKRVAIPRKNICSWLDLVFLGN